MDSIRFETVPLYIFTIIRSPVSARNRTIRKAVRDLLSFCKSFYFFL